MDRVAFEMTEADLAELLAAMKPEPLMYLSGGMPMRGGSRFFTAIPTAKTPA